MRNAGAETIIGALVVAIAAAFLWFALSHRDAAAATGRSAYDVVARFSNVGGVARGTDVRIAGVKAGVVRDVALDGEFYEAVVTMSLDRQWKIPDDSDARVSSDGLLGGAHIAIVPGGSEDYIAQDGKGEIERTQGSVDLLTLFASFAAGGGDDEAAPEDEALSNDLE
jgi:phospholipid/cholesterol/gamma-HCH transport system substrate-binding protein